MDKHAQIETVVSKAVEAVLPNKEFVISQLSSGKRLTIYAGFDPTAPTLHIGHAIQLRKLRQLQDLGHQIIFLIGDFTARIGDPTDKSAARTQLTEKQVKQNLAHYKKQASNFIRFTGKNKALVKFNSAWLAKLKFADVIALASHMTVDQMLKRDMFVRRMNEEKPIYLHEFFYPLMQGYDSVVMDVDGEVGGNDQLFNMMAGRTLLKQLKSKEKFVITLKLLEDGNGKKMGKSEGNMVSLSDTPEDIYGKVMSWPDSLLSVGFELCTDVASQEAEKIIGANPRDAKMRLAWEIVKSIHTEKIADRAQEVFVQTFQKKEITDSLPEVEGRGRTLEEIFLDKHLVTSKGELRRLAAAGAITNFSTKQSISFEELKTPSVEGVYKIGKNRFIKIR